MQQKLNGIWSDLEVISETEIGIELEEDQNFKMLSVRCCLWGKQHFWYWNMVGIELSGCQKVINLHFSVLGGLMADCLG